MEQIDVRRGMARFGFVVLVLWEAFAIFSIIFLMVLDNPSVDIWDLVKVLLICCIVIPGAVWMCWRALLRVVRGFVPEVPTP